MNWLTAAVIVFLVLMVGYGARKGFVRMVMSFAAVLLTFLIVVMIHEPLERTVKEQTEVYTWIEDRIRGFVVEGTEKAVKNVQVTVQEMIDQLELPDIIKESLIKENVSENYEEIDANTAEEYVVECLSDLVLSALIYVISFILVRIGIWIVMIILDSVVQIPVLRQLNSLAGGVVGLVVAILLLWVGGLIVTAGAASSWGQEMVRMIGENVLLSTIYNNNFFMKFLI